MTVATFQRQQPSLASSARSPLYDPNWSIVPLPTIIQFERLENRLITGLELAD